MDGSAAAGAPSPIVTDVHGSSGDIDSLLTNEPDLAADKATRRLLEPYERHRAHDLRAECYRRGIRPIKKGPHANDNKNGYIVLLRKYDGTAPAGAHAHAPPHHANGMELRDDERVDVDDDDSDDRRSAAVSAACPLAKKRRISTQTPSSLVAASVAAAAAAAAVGVSSADLQGFYEHATPTLVPVAGLPMQYPNMMKAGPPPTVGAGSATAEASVAASAPPAATTTDLEILSGIANTYTQNTLADGQLCTGCRSLVTDQLMESIRLGRNKMQQQETHRWMEQRERDTMYLKELLEIIATLRKAHREALAEGGNEELLEEMESDLVFFLTLKKRTKERLKPFLHGEAMRDRSGSGMMMSGANGTPIDKRDI
ncbi:TPA: hypothetical protein N0F65_006614 [Lagenidium giganteum]|uniref:Uncharacterized protein n=1 Tax=Lagenidium giganteum TaxID=4803 RepID=A0AAV2ZBF4_9STRA|nr:TPA: hypothetical protein N0F65_006614 [Lagenidium giganteum]